MLCVKNLNQFSDVQNVALKATVVRSVRKFTGQYIDISVDMIELSSGILIYHPKKKRGIKDLKVRQLVSTRCLSPSSTILLTMMIAYILEGMMLRKLPNLVVLTKEEELERKVSLIACCFCSSRNSSTEKSFIDLIGLLNDFKSNSSTSK